LTGTVPNRAPGLIFINQIREKNRSDVRQSGNHYRRPCLEVLILGARDIRRIAAIKEGDVMIGSRTKSKW